jgi:hypothetical protein
MAWRKLEDTFYDSPKIKRLARNLDIDRPTAAGMIVLLWSWALRHAPDGDLSKFEIEDIEDAACWSGNRGDFLHGCVKSRLIDLDDNGEITLHNWMLRGGSFAENQRKQRHKARKRQSDVAATSWRRPGDVAATENPVIEERRGDKNIYTSNVTSCCTNVQIVDQPRPEQARLESGQPISPKETRNDVAEVWEHYRTHHPKAVRVLKSGRKEYRLIKQRLQDFGVDEIKRAIDGYHKSTWHCGDNPSGKRYQSLDLILRDCSHVQAGLEYLDAKPTTGRASQRLLDDPLALEDDRHDQSPATVVET